MSNTQKSRTSKRQGPIRWSGFVPVLTLLAGFGIYINFFLDAHLKYGLSQVASSLNGAWVDIGKLKTSLLNCTFEMTDIEVGDPALPMRNRAAISRVYYQFLFRPILSKKFVIREASISGIRWGTERRTSGELPTVPDKPSGPAAVPGVLNGVMANLAQIAKQQAAETSLGQFSGLTPGNVETDIERLGDNSASSKQISEISRNLDLFNEQWQKSLEGLPTDKTLEDFKDQISMLSNSRPTNPSDFSVVVARANTLKTQIDDKSSELKKSHDLITSQSQSITKSFAKIDDALNEDINSIRAKLKIPSLNLKDLTPALMGPKVSHWLSQAIYWADLSRKYLPKKSKPGSNRVEQKRIHGTDIHFSPVKSYPAFLLEKALIESNVAQDTRAGNVTGSILGLNSHPPSYGKPTEFSLKGEFPAARISGADISIVVDHVTESATERAQIKIDSFPIENLILSNDPSFSVGIENASGKAAIDLTFGENSMSAKFSALIAGIRYRSASNMPQLENILTRVLGQLPAFEMAASVTGPFDNLDFQVSSDLGRKLASGVTVEFEKALSDLNGRIKQAVDTEFAFRKRDLISRSDTLRRDAMSPIKERLGQFQSFSKTVELIPQRLEAEKQRLVKRAEDEVRSKAKSQLNQEAEKLKQSIKLPGF